MTNWKRSVGQGIRYLTPEEARAKLHAIQARNVEQGKATIEQPIIRALTGGYACQSINAYVIRKLAEKAGLAIKEAAHAPL